MEKRSTPYPGISNIIRLRRIDQSQCAGHGDDLPPVVGAVLEAVECDLRIGGLKNVSFQIAVLGSAGEERLAGCTQEIRPAPAVVEQAVEQFGVGTLKVIRQEPGGRFALQAAQPDVLRAPDVQQGAAQGREGGGRFPGHQGVRFFPEPVANQGVGPKVVVRKVDEQLHNKGS